MNNCRGNTIAGCNDALALQELERSTSEWSAIINQMNQCASDIADNYSDCCDQLHVNYDTFTAKFGLFDALLVNCYTSINTNFEAALAQMEGIVGKTVEQLDCPTQTTTTTTFTTTSSTSSTSSTSTSSTSTTFTTSTSTTYTSSTFTSSTTSTTSTTTSTTSTTSTSTTTQLPYLIVNYIDADGIGTDDIADGVELDMYSGVPPLTFSGSTVSFQMRSSEDTAVTGAIVGIIFSSPLNVFRLHVTSQTFTVTYVGTESVGTYWCVISITSDLNEDPFEIQLTLTIA